MPKNVRHHASWLSGYSFINEVAKCGGQYLPHSQVCGFLYSGLRAQTQIQGALLPIAATFSALPSDTGAFPEAWRTEMEVSRSFLFPFSPPPSNPTQGTHGQ